MNIEVGDWVQFKYWKNDQIVIAEVQHVSETVGVSTTMGLIRADSILEVRQAGQAQAKEKR